MCTAIVVREKYWEDVVNIYCKASGLEQVKFGDLRRCALTLRRFGELVTQAINQLASVIKGYIDRFVAEFKESWRELKEWFNRNREKFHWPDEKKKKRLCYHRYHRDIGLNYRDMDYAKNCFKLSKRHVGIMNHIKV